MRSLWPGDRNTLRVRRPSLTQGFCDLGRKHAQSGDVSIIQYIIVYLSTTPWFVVLDVGNFMSMMYDYM